MKVLITGGAGFIGSHLCDSRISMGDEVTILDNFRTGSRQNIKHIDNVINKIDGNIKDQKLVESLVANSDLVLHMAAAVGVKTILDDPVESISTNFAGSEVILNACTKLEKRLVIASTSEIYGKNAKQPLSEIDDRIMGAPQKLRWSYADSKALEEAMAYALHLSKNLNVITVRFFNVVGPRQSAEYGMVLPRFIRAALHNKPIEVYGDGKQQRVFCHVLDAVDAINGLLNNSHSLGQVFNIGGLQEISIIDLANLVKAELDSNSKIVFKPYLQAYGEGFEDMMRRVPDLKKIQDLISWSPKINLTGIIKDIAKSLS
jgi:UDP-glucose 4-epimerase